MLLLKVPEFHWILGTTLHDLYIVGASTVKGLIEKLALKWIQENLTLEKQDINQVKTFNSTCYVVLILYIIIVR